LPWTTTPLEVLGTILKAFSADVLEARDGRDALAYVDTTPGLVAIITDLSMPGMDDVELARKVREQPSRRRAPGGGVPGSFDAISAALVFASVTTSACAYGEAISITADQTSGQGALHVAFAFSRDPIEASSAAGTSL
jgi:hypothetical protein